MLLFHFACIGSACPCPCVSTMCAHTHTHVQGCCVVQQACTWANMLWNVTQHMLCAVAFTPMLHACHVLFLLWGSVVAPLSPAPPPPAYHPPQVPAAYVACHLPPLQGQRKGAGSIHWLGAALGSGRGWPQLGVGCWSGVLGGRERWGVAGMAAVGHWRKHTACRHPIAHERRSKALQLSSYMQCDAIGLPAPPPGLPPKGQHELCGRGACLSPQEAH